MDEQMAEADPSQKRELGLPFVNCQKLAEFKNRHLCEI
jgi:hypothetical protein